MTNQQSPFQNLTPQEIQTLYYLQQKMQQSQQGQAPPQYFQPNQAPPNGEQPKKKKGVKKAAQKASKMDEGEWSWEMKVIALIVFVFAVAYFSR
jgi:hypothetical protein